MNEAFPTIDAFRSFAAKINMTMAIFDVLIERHRQRAEENFAHVDDDRLDKGQLACAAACYTFSSLPHFTSTPLATDLPVIVGYLWPFDWSMWKPKDRRADLVRAAALLLAEIERIDRATPMGPAHG